MELGNSNSDESYYSQDTSICSPSPLTQIDAFFDTFGSLANDSFNINDDSVSYGDIANEGRNNVVEYIYKSFASLTNDSTRNAENETNGLENEFGKWVPCMILSLQRKFRVNI